jgi:hypothetical protein
MSFYIALTIGFVIGGLCGFIIMGLLVSNTVCKAENCKDRR